VKAAASRPWRLVDPTKMAKAKPREIDREAIRMAMEKENTIPTLAEVRSIPEEMPKTWGGDAFITAEELAGKKQLAPTPLTTLATTTSHRPVWRERWA